MTLVVTDATAWHAALMQRISSYSSGARLLAEKLVEGVPMERRGVVSWEIDAAGRCEAPYAFSHTYRGGYSVAERARRARDGDRALFLDGVARCRKCDACRRHRRSLWAHRAQAELQRASRTWWGTLTLNPGVRALVVNEALADGRGNLTFARQCAVVGRRIQRWLKRLRKSGARLRYFLVFEAHKDGVPHVHLLLHEMSTGVTQAQLEAEWTDGFSYWRLVGDTHEDSQKVSMYLTKYMLKSTDVRIRASLRYGTANSVVASELPEKAALSPVEAEKASGEGDDPPSVSFSRPRPLGPEAEAAQAAGD